MKKVVIKTEYITLGQLLKFASIIGSGGEVKFFLQNTDIFLNSELENRRGKKIYPGDQVRVGFQTYLIESDET